MPASGIGRRSVLRGLVGPGALWEVQSFSQVKPARAALVDPKDSIKITKVETFFVKPRWLFLKVHTDAGIVGLGEATPEGRTRIVATAVAELGRYLAGKDPCNVLTHWRAMYGSPGPYRGGSSGSRSRCSAKATASYSGGGLGLTLAEGGSTLKSKGQFAQLSGEALNMCHGSHGTA